MAMVNLITYLFQTKVVSQILDGLSFMVPREDESYFLGQSADFYPVAA